MTFTVELASRYGTVVETVDINTIDDLRNIAKKYNDKNGGYWKKDEQDLIIEFVNIDNEPRPRIIVYDDWME